MMDAVWNILMASCIAGSKRKFTFHFTKSNKLMQSDIGATNLYSNNTIKDIFLCLLWLGFWHLIFYAYFYFFKKKHFELEHFCFKLCLNLEFVKFLQLQMVIVDETGLSLLKHQGMQSHATSDGKKLTMIILNIMIKGAGARIKFPKTFETIWRVL